MLERLVCRSTLVAAVIVAFAMLLSEPSSGLDNNNLNATGDACTIDLPDGLKEPGTVNSNGRCCSVLHTDKCYDIPKSVNSTSTRKPNLPKNLPPKRMSGGTTAPVGGNKSGGDTTILRNSGGNSGSSKN